MERIKNTVQEDNAATAEEKMKQETEDEMETPTGVFTQETITAWEKKSPSKERRTSRPPRFSRLLSRLSEEQMSSQENLETSMDSLKHKLEDLASGSSVEEQLNGQSSGIPVNFSTASLPEPQEIPAVETVETEPKGLEDEVPSTSKDAEDEDLIALPSQTSIKTEEPSYVPVRRTATVHSIHSKVLDPQDSVASLSDTGPSVWRMGQRISHWKLAHQRGYHIDQLTHDKDLKNTIMKHERETKAAVPLPLQGVIEEEALAILTQTLKAYQKHLGADHYLTQQLEEQAEKVHLRLKGRGVIE